MQYAARNAKPGCGNRFSLTASPQNKPETVQYGSVGLSVPPRTRPALLFGKELFCDAPYRSWHFAIVRTFWFCGILFHDLSRLVLVCGNRILSRIRLFIQPFLFSDRFLFIRESFIANDTNVRMLGIIILKDQEYFLF